MKRLTHAQKEAIQHLCNSDSSLNKIAQTLSLSKGTTYYWYRKIKGKKITPINIKTNSVEKVGEIIGIFAGDDNYTVDNSYKHQISIFINAEDKKYINHVEKLMYDLCTKKPFVYTIQKSNVTILRIVSKRFFVFISTYLKWGHTKTKTIELRDEATHLGKKFNLGFLRGLLDTDGYIDQKNHRAVYSTISKKLACNIKEALKIFNIKYSEYQYIDPRPNRNPIFRIIISEDFEKLMRIINPKHFNYLVAHNKHYTCLGNVVV